MRAHLALIWFGVVWLFCSGAGHIGEAGGMSAAVNAHADEIWAFLAIHLNLSTAVCPPRERR